MKGVTQQREIKFDEPRKASAQKENFCLFISSVPLIPLVPLVPLVLLLFR